MNKRRKPWTGPRNPYRLLPPSQKIIDRARRAGVDTTNRPAIERWIANQEKPK